MHSRARYSNRTKHNHSSEKYLCIVRNGATAAARKCALLTIPGFTCVAQMHREVWMREGKLICSRRRRREDFARPFSSSKCIQSLVLTIVKLNCAQIIIICTSGCNLPRCVPIELCPVPTRVNFPVFPFKVAQTHQAFRIEFCLDADDFHFYSFTFFFFGCRELQFVFCATHGPESYLNCVRKKKWLDRTSVWRGL